MLALCWHSTSVYYACYFAGIFDAGQPFLKPNSTQELHESYILIYPVIQLHSSVCVVILKEVTNK